MKRVWGVYRVSIFGRRLLSAWSDKADAETVARESRINTEIAPIIINHGEHSRRRAVRAAAEETGKDESNYHGE